jgi:hypothetical protein
MPWPLEEVVVPVPFGQGESRHAVDGGDVDPCRAAFGVVLVVLREPPVSVEPPEGPFDHPTPRLDLEAQRALMTGHDVQSPFHVCTRPVGQRSLRRVGPHPCQPRQRLADPLLDGVPCSPEHPMLVTYGINPSRLMIRSTNPGSSGGGPLFQLSLRRTCPYSASLSNGIDRARP